MSVLTFLVEASADGERGIRTINPIALARRVHFPVMLYFCAFVVVHVVLVLSTGALRNLNHMFGHRDTDDWTGAIVFIAGVAVMAGAWLAVRPVLVAPVASLFGRVRR